MFKFLLKSILSFFILTTCETKPLTTLVLPITFVSNLGWPIPPVCNVATINYLLTADTNSFKETLEESSNKTLTLNTNDITYVPVNSNRYASSLGCITATFYLEAKEYYNSLNLPNKFDSFDIRLLILPVSAGGGSCARALYYSTRDYSFIRSCDIVTVTQSISSSLGLFKAGTEDLSDPMGILNPKYPYYVPMFNPLNRLKLGWLKQSYIKNFTFGKNYITSASLTNPIYPILIKGPVTTDLLDSHWISYRGWSPRTSDRYLPNSYINCVFIHRSNLLEAKLCKIGEEYIDAPSGTRLSLSSKNNFSAEIVFVNCVQRQPSISISKIHSNLLSLFVFNNNDLKCNFTSSYKVLFDKVPIGYNIDGIGALGRKISVNLVLDINPLEVSFEFSDSRGILFAKPTMTLRSGLYSFIYNGTFGSEITFKLFDGGGDGICCQYGGGSYYQIIVGDTVIHTGGQFAFVDVFKFTAKPVQIFWNLYPKTYSNKLNLTLYDTDKTSDNNFSLKVLTLNSKIGYAIKILPELNYTFKI